MDGDENAGLVDEEREPATSSQPTCWRRFRFCRLTALALTSAALLALAAVEGSPLRRLWELSNLEDVVQLADKGAPPNYRGGQALDPKAGSDMGVCVGHVISAGAWAAAAALKVTSAMVECDLRSYVDGAKISSLGIGFRKKPIALDPSLRGPMCARSVLGFIRDLASVGTHLETSADYCGKDRIDDIKCASAVTNAVRNAAHFSRFASELDAFCPQDSGLRNFFLCANRIEGMGWAIDAMLGAISGAARTCGATAADLPQPPAQYGSCVGEVLGAAGYIAAAGFNTYNAANFSCLGALEPEKIAKLTHFEKERINAQCAQLSASSARQFAIAAAKASEAAGHCSSITSIQKEGRCGRTLALGLAALAGAAEGAGFMRRECLETAPCCQSRVGSPFEFECNCTSQKLLDRVRRGNIRAKRCARFTSSTLKELAMVVTMMSEGASECGGPDIAGNACTHLLGGAFAGLFFFSEAISRMTLRCHKSPNHNFFQYFACSQDQGFMGEAIDTMAVAIGASLRDCGLGYAPGRERKSSWLGFGRRYFLP
ncbi:unnamed protein product [Symbiodinium natans]|uniref:Uncharacterized protein n=1 Tax=Symbiodinium natans TaxID=878477 RepID=A0A812TG52_9DINO|nr:unnamed protein product [Symbiodinium natans]